MGIFLYTPHLILQYTYFYIAIMPIFKITNKMNAREYFHDVRRSYGLIMQFVVRNIVVKYKNSFLGILWALLEPVCTLLIFIFVFGVLGRFNLSNNAIPYPLIVISGIVCWQFFSTNLVALGDSLIAGEHILKKIYFPHIIMSISASLAVIVEFLVVLCCFVVALLLYRVPLSLRALWALPVIAQIYLLAVGPGLLMATLNLKYRDFKHLIPLILRLGFYVCPIAYSIELVINQQRFAPWVVNAYFLNPMVGPITTFRWAFFGGALHIPSLLFSLGFSVTFFAIGLFVFIKNEASLVDNI